MKAPQERKTPKKIDRLADGNPNIKMSGSTYELTVTEVLEGHNHSVTFIGRDQVETLRDFAQAWLDHDAEPAGEPFYKVFCLECGEDYVVDMIELTVTCRECGSEQVEWEGFEV